MNIKKVTVKNFLSFGNSSVEFSFNNNELAILSGRNGQGKSSINEAITFGLYGKTLRNLKKNELVNKINRKECLIEIEFEQRGIDYKIRRGISPNIFEIYKNEELINQSSSVLDYQAILETEILGLSYTMFRQLVILSPSSFTPFFEMNASNRRNVLEELLGLTEISSMLSILNGRMAECKSEQNTLKATAVEINNTIKTLKENLAKAVESSSEIKAQIEERVERINIEILQSQSSIENKIQELTELNIEQNRSRLDTLDSAVRQINNTINEITVSTKKLKSEIKFVEEQSHCPTCNQEMSETHRDEVRNNNQKKIEEYESKIETIGPKLDTILSERDIINNIISKSSEISEEIKALTRHIRSLQKQVEDTTSLISDDENKNETFINEKIDIERSRLDDTLSLLQQLAEKFNLYQSTKSFLSDDGIRKHIVQKYIPFVTKRVNEWLELLDFFAVLEISGDFEEVIKVRGFDPTRYANLSSGERAKLTLALVMTFRELISLRSNSVWNLLSLDEILETIDAESKSKLFWSLRSISEKENLSIYVVSHGTTMTDQFHRVLEVAKVGNFTKITEVEQ